MVELADDQKFRKLIERVWSDPSLKSRLKASPADVLEEFGIAAPSGCKIDVIESDAKQRYFILPPAPDAHLTVAEIKAKSEASDYKAFVHVLYDVNCC